MKRGLERCKSKKFAFFSFFSFLYKNVVPLESITK